MVVGLQEGDQVLHVAWLLEDQVGQDGLDDALPAHPESSSCLALLPAKLPCEQQGTVPKSQGDPKIVKRGPKGDPIFGKKGTQRGPFLT